MHCSLTSVNDENDSFHQVPDNTYLEVSKTPNDHTKESALSFYLEYNFSVRMYKALVSDCRARGSSLYRSYNSIDQIRKECLVLPYDLQIETEVRVTLPDILNKTSERLFYSVGTMWPEENLQNLSLIVTTGFDSSSGHGNAHQQFADENNKCSDPQQSLFVTNMAVLQLKSDLNGKIVYSNSIQIYYIM